MNTCYICNHPNPSHEVLVNDKGNLPKTIHLCNKHYARFISGGFGSQKWEAVKIEIPKAFRNQLPEKHPDNA